MGALPQHLFVWLTPDSDPELTRRKSDHKYKTRSHAEPAMDFFQFFKIFFQFFQDMHKNIRKTINFRRGQRPRKSFFPIFSSYPPPQKIPGSTPAERPQK